MKNIPANVTLYQSAVLIVEEKPNQQIFFHYPMRYNKEQIDNK